MEVEMFIGIICFLISDILVSFIGASALKLFIPEWKNKYTRYFIIFFTYIIIFLLIYLSQNK